MTRPTPSRLREISAFLVVGGVAFVVQLALLNTLVWAGVGALPANAIATCCSIAVAYVGNRTWSFAHRAGTDRRREAIAFVVVNAVTLALSEALLAVTYLFGAQHDRLVVNAVTVLGIATGTALRYVGYRKLVFVAVPPTATESEVAAPVRAAVR